MIYPLFPLPFLYAETHFRLFKGLWSRLFRKEAEIIADSIWRIDPGLTIPLFIFIKDANLFPVTLKNIEITFTGLNKCVHFNFDYDLKINEKSWWCIEYIDPSEFDLGQTIEMNVEINYLDFKNKAKNCINDNYYPQTPPLTIYLAKNTLAKMNNWFQGDLHVHSEYTDDQIEFGAPVRVTAAMGRSLGLDFIGITDHAYDLDDATDSYLKNDPQLPKWKSYLDEVKAYNQVGDKPLIIHGFEVSVENSKENSVHLQVFNSQELFLGSSDSGEKWIHSKPEWQLKHIIDRLPAKSIACAAHIGEKAPFIHRILLGRGFYDAKDLENEKLVFFQLANSRDIKKIKKSIDLWVYQLLRGKRVTPLAGSDSHGNFNFNRSVILPHLSMSISKMQLIGEVRTAVWSNNEIQTIDDFLNALQIGRVQITTGPFVDIVKLGKDESLLGSTIHSVDTVYQFSAISSEEAGELVEIKIISGLKKQKEEIFKLIKTDSFNFSMELKFDTDLNNILYFRFEANTNRGEFCISAPVYVEYKSIS